MTGPLLVYSTFPLLLLPLLLAFNILVALSPLVRRKDHLTDIPLSAAQRALLGLDPSAASPATPAAEYITPPRYPRSSTPVVASPGSRASSYSDSPLSGKGGPLLNGLQARSRSPHSATGSPSWQRAMHGANKEVTRRSSYGSPSPFGAGAGGASSVMGAPATPSPTVGKGASVVLNSRWLYERGRGSPGSSKMFA